MSNYRHQRRKEKLMALFEKHGLRPRTTFGQNFLLDKNQVSFIARTGDAKAGDIILEVGPGTGFLTRELAETGATVIACELDHGMAKVVSSEMEDFPNFFLIEADILSGKNDINPEVINRVTEMLQARPGELKCISNLPYSAGTPFAANLFESPLPWTTGVYMLQLEVGQRLAATPGSNHYGALSIKAALGGKVKIERKVPPQVFWPRPKVASAVVRIEFNSVEERLIIPWKELRQVCISVSNSRRKNLRNALKGLLPKEEVVDFLESCGADPDARGQNVAPEIYLAMATELKRRQDAEEETPT